MDSVVTSSAVDSWVQALVS